MEYNYAIFDMDGTLVDSTGLWDAVGDTVLSHWGKHFPRSDRKDTLTMTIEGTAAYFVQHYALPVSAATVAQMIREEAARAYAAEGAVRPGVTRVLDYFKARGTKLCVASGTEKALVDAALGRLGLLPYFAFTMSCETPEGKESPEVYLRAMQALGAKAPDEVLVFEDSPTAVRTAARAGFYTAAVKDTYTVGDWESLKTVADIMVEDWNAFADTLGSTCKI